LLQLKQLAVIATIQASLKCYRCYRYAPCCPNNPLAGTHSHLRLLPVSISHELVVRLPNARHAAPPSYIPAAVLPPKLFAAPARKQTFSSSTVDKTKVPLLGSQSGLVSPEHQELCLQASWIRALLSRTSLSAWNEARALLNDSPWADSPLPPGALHLLPLPMS